MSAPGAVEPGPRFALRGGGGVELAAEGLRHPRVPRAPARVLTPYTDITHLSCSTRALWIGTRHTVHVLARGFFVDARAPEHLVRGLVERIAQLPGGGAQLARMARIEELAARPAPPLATLSLLGLCVAVFAVHLLLGADVQDAGALIGPLVREGDLWRLVTANLLHGYPRFPLHLVLNGLALLGLGALIERPLGAARTACVMGASGLGAMGLVLLAAGGGPPVVGASGVIHGVAAALLWLELRRGEELPAWWRVPRGPLVTVLLADGLLSVVLPFISVPAHLGGFAAGMAAATWLGRGPLGRAPAPRALRVGATLVVAVALLGLAAAALELLRPGDFATRHAYRLVRLADVSPLELNRRAWEIAIAPETPQKRMEAALLLAERAVERSRRAIPEILDTLAEVQFQLGWTDRALESIDEALALAPDDPYYAEQRRRFAGERDADDRPSREDPLASAGAGERPAAEP